eukprot:TCALIF_00675-PA protein Name:"Protein of unknown function" AED:0.12 eAED:0.12 QI:1049/0.85/0.87/1/0.28/0.62/8/0/70
MTWDMDGSGNPIQVITIQMHYYQSPISVPPSEENIRLLMDMGFTRDRVENALRQVNNDVQSATTLLVQGM